MDLIRLNSSHKNQQQLNRDKANCSNKTKGIT